MWRPAMWDKRHAPSPKQQGGRRRLAAASATRLLLLLLVLAALVVRLRYGPGMGPQLTVHTKKAARRRLSPASLDNAELLARAAAAGAFQPVHGLEVNSGGGPGQYSGVGRTLSFPVCGGFASQRVALVSGVVLAAELNRTLLLPRLLLGAAEQGTADFGDMYDAAAFASRMRAQGLLVATDAPPAESSVSVHLDQRFDYMAALATTYAPRQHLRVDCPFSKVPAELMVKHEGLVFAALGALQPAPALQDVLSRIEGRLQGLSGTKAYNVLHLRAEQDWVEHCKQWASIDDGIVRDNCLNNTAGAGDRLRLHHVEPEVPLLLVTGWTQINDSLVREAVHSLKSQNYLVVRRDGILEKGEMLPQLSGEQSALIDYYLALRCHQFIGNSVSVFSALLIMERWHAGSFATHYNGGNIPLEALMPLYPMPWVFTYNDWSAGTEYEHMVRAAVTSGIQVARMRAFCMFSGSETSAMYQWLVGQGVTIIRHDPAWKEALIQEGLRYREEYSKLYSHLYKTDGALVGAFQRIDLPVLPEFDQYNYVLFTDCDVYFRQHMKLFDFGTPLPSALGLGFENEDKFPYNDGVMLWNMPYMRKTNAAFVSWILNQTNGLYFKGYGPVDQGAFNQYYEQEIKGKPINKNFNAKMYHELRKSARIVHFHGPKPNHYLQYFLTQKCGTFQDMCKNGLEKGGLCPYAIEYGRLQPDWGAARRLGELCINIKAGTFHFPWADLQQPQPCQQQAAHPAAVAAAGAHKKEGNHTAGAAGLASTSNAEQPHPADPTSVAAADAEAASKDGGPSSDSSSTASAVGGGTASNAASDDSSSGSGGGGSTSSSAVSAGSLAAEGTTNSASGSGSSSTINAKSNEGGTDGRTADGDGSGMAASAATASGTSGASVQQQQSQQQAAAASASAGSSTASAQQEQQQQAAAASSVTGSSGDASAQQQEQKPATVSSGTSSSDASVGQRQQPQPASSSGDAGSGEATDQQQQQQPAATKARPASPGGTLKVQPLEAGEAVVSIAQLLRKPGQGALR